ncbi:hypothetical protein F444_06103 [Phytophthora nicotianae P1976]|uniref:Uncharacterized protein n=3 Tax=Phytophthora nicotianae TaxID=4792 RepID=A0A081AJV1_PHYNI|nr:hypothetical protein F444_06103 [Phytophthora nicotianae P1976]
MRNYHHPRLAPPKDLADVELLLFFWLIVGAALVFGFFFAGGTRRGKPLEEVVESVSPLASFLQQGDQNINCSGSKATEATVEITRLDTVAHTVLNSSPKRMAFFTGFIEDTVYGVSTAPDACDYMILPRPV